jgi:GTP cyclohydrolase II
MRPADALGEFTLHAFVEHATGKEHLAMALGDLATASRRWRASTRNA